MPHRGCWRSGLTPEGGSDKALRRAESGRLGIATKARLLSYLLAGIAFSGTSTLACTYSLTNATTGAPVTTITLTANSPGDGTFFFLPGSQDDSSLIAVGTPDCGTPQSPPPPATVTVTGSWVALDYATGPFPNGQAWDISIGLKRQANPFPTPLTGTLSIAGGGTLGALSNAYIIVEPPCESNYSASVCSPSISFNPLPAALEVGTPIPNRSSVTASGAEVGQAGFIPATFSVLGGQLPPGVMLETVHQPGGHDASGGYDYALLSGTPSAAGKFTFTLQAVDSGGRTVEKSFTQVITAGPIAASPSSLLFSFVQSNSTLNFQSLTVTNGTAQAVAVSSTTSGQSWLSVSPANLDVPAFSSSAVTVSVNPSGLAPGTYAGAVTLAGASQQFVVSVYVTVSSAQLAIAISQTALRFKAALGGGSPASQSITVLNQGSGPLNWSAEASTLVGSWLSVTPGSGAAGDAATVSVNPSGLAAGDYYGLVQFTASGAANSPQTAVVVLNVLAANNSAPVVEPAGLIFTSAQDGSNPAAQTVTVSNPSSQSVMVTPSAPAQQNGLFSVTPSSSVTIASDQSSQFTISANLSGLAAGVYSGLVDFQFGDGSVQQVAISLIVTPATGASAVQAGIHAATTEPVCTPTMLLPVSTALGQSFTEVAAWPTPLIIQVVDDCGSPMGPGTVVASFSTGDPPLSLVSLGAGMWSGTWEPRYTANVASVVITVQAQSSQPALTGTLAITGTLEPNQNAPVISAGGVVSAASLAANAPLAPGAFVSIFGANFAASDNQASSLPLQSQLGGSEAIIAGESMPLLFTNAGQVNAIIPYTVAVNSPQQVIVQQNMAYSLPETVTLAPAQPGVFTQNQSGMGIGVIVVVKPDGTQFEIGSSHPATAGDGLVIYCTGLGPVTPSIAAGSAAPTSPLSKSSSPVTVTIGDQPAQVLYAGLSPGFAGLYQVNVVIPAGISAASDVPVILTEGGLASPPVTIPIQ
jgi:uncharacterized protein (TIGR03437 family)